MIGDVPESFKIMIPAVNQKFVRKSWIEASICHSASLEKLTCQSCLFRLRQFAAQCLRNLNSKQRRNEEFAAHSVSFKT